MRSAAFIAALAAAALACGDARADGTRESRYGPAPERPPSALNGRSPAYSGASYGGRALGWSGKREPAPALAQPALAQPTLDQPGAARTDPAQEPWSTRAPVARPQAAVPVAPALPQSIYDAPPAAPIPPTYAPPTPRPAAQPGQVEARVYSVGRQFGMSPDPIPAAGPPRMVLIGPPATAPDDEDARGDDEWSAKPQKDSDQ